MSYCTDQRLAVLDTARGISFTTYRTHLQLVCGQISRGSLGNIRPRDIGCWASSEHLTAVNAVIDHAMKVRTEIEEAQAKEEEASDE